MCRADYSLLMRSSFPVRIIIRVHMWFFLSYLQGKKVHRSDEAATERARDDLHHVS